VPSPRSRAVVRTVALVFICFVLLSVLAVAATGGFVPYCGLCHSNKAFATATAAAPHRTVECAACHVGSGAPARIAFAFLQVPHVASALLPGAASGTAAIPDARCLACHRSVQKGVVARNGLRIRHSSCAKGSTCLDCHSNTAHGAAAPWQRTYSMDLCLHCHGTDPKLSKCDLCHQGRTATARLTSGPWVVTHGPNWRQTHGMGDEFTCPTCHPKGYCDPCHGPGLPHGPDFRTVHPTFAVMQGAQCSTCHKPAFCVDCHGGLQMPHPKSFIETHKQIVTTGGSAVCDRCHSKSDCNTCHVMHIHPGGVRMGSTLATASP
jgi:hypothetical protein